MHRLLGSIGIISLYILKWNNKHYEICFYILLFFYGDSPSVSEFLCQFRDEYKLWCLAGAKKLHALGLDRVGAFG